MSDYDEALAGLFGLEARGMRMSLDAVDAYSATLGNPERAYPSIHVAGTNGKGTTVECVAALARRRGLRTATYTSPHLVDFRERIKIDDRPIEVRELVRRWERLAPAAHDRDLTFFEATTLIALEYFADQEVDLAVIETGLGGRFDATRVIDTRVAVITSIDLDHEGVLGSELTGIAREKAGIVRAGRPVVVGDPGTSACRAVIEREAADAGAPTTYVSEAASWCVHEIGFEGTRFSFDGAGLTVDDARVSAIGQAFARGACTGLVAWRAYADECDATCVRDAFADVSLPGRGEWHTLGGSGYLLDVAHNPAAIESLVETIDALELAPAAIVFGAMGDKPWPAMIDRLERVADRGWVCDLGTAPELRRLRAADAVGPLAERPTYAWSPTVGEALAMAKESVVAGDARAVVVTGSFHTVGEALVVLGLAEPGTPYVLPVCGASDGGVERA